MANPVLYVIINGGLKMSGGKGAAQAVHAAMMLSNKHRNKFTAHAERTVVVLEAKNSEQLRNLHEYLGRHDIRSEYYIDEGRNEVDPYSVTALAVEPIDSEDVHKRAIFAVLHFFEGKHYKRWYKK